jgi:uncharacterized membrane protein YkvA (DUF1232 family)
VTQWQVGLIALGVAVVVYAALVGVLALVGRGTEARALARFVPDCIVLFRGLLSDQRVSRAPKLLMLGLVAYLAMPFDLVPDFIPVAGQLDDVILVALVLRAVLRSAGVGPVRDHWRGPEASLNAVLRLAGHRSPATAS